MGKGKTTKHAKSSKNMKGGRIFTTEGTEVHREGDRFGVRRHDAALGRNSQTAAEGLTRLETAAAPAAGKGGACRRPVPRRRIGAWQDAPHGGGFQGWHWSCWYRGARR